jgi:hypothetical protein
MIYFNIISGVYFNLSVEESIVNALVVSLQSKNTNNTKSEVRFKQPVIRGAFIIDFSTPILRINLNEHQIFYISILKRKTVYMYQFLQGKIMP